MKDQKSENREKKRNRYLVPTRGRTFQGKVIKKFHTRAVVEFERTVYIPKYERYYKKNTRLHSRIPKEINLAVGDYVKVRECRPLSKIIHSIIIEKIRSKGEIE